MHAEPQLAFMMKPSYNGLGLGLGPASIPWGGVLYLVYI